MKAAKALGAAIDAVRSMVPRFLSIARELWHEIIGFLFFAFSLFFAVGPVGFVQVYRNNPEDTGRLLVSGAGALLFAWFGFDSFRRAKRLARQREED